MEDLNKEILKVFSEGPSVVNQSQGTSKKPQKKRKQRRSKLDPHSKFILDLYSKGLSNQHIATILIAQMNIESCDKTCVFRFVKRSTSL